MILHRFDVSCVNHALIDIDFYQWVISENIETEGIKIPKRLLSDHHTNVYENQD